MTGDMEESQKAVEDFLRNGGETDTTVEEVVAPAVTHETIYRQEEEEVTTAINKEIHQDHYHTTVQPIDERETLPETHTHQVLEVEERAVEHGNSEDTQRRLESEAAQYRDEQVVSETAHTHSTKPVLVSEHIHHHIHEVIQPIIQREVIQPSVIHTTVPVHEVHHNASQHHNTSSLPSMSIEEFRRLGGALHGRQEQYDRIVKEQPVFRDDKEPQ